MRARVVLHAQPEEPIESKLGRQRMNIDFRRASEADVSILGEEHVSDVTTGGVV